MRILKQVLLIMVLFSVFACKKSGHSKIENTIQAKEKPTVSFTFDDGITTDIVNYKFEEWNQMILSSLAEAQVKSMFFVTGFNKTDKKGNLLLSEWDKQNHKIANHTFSHPNYNDKNNTVEDFKEELLKTDLIISQYNNYVKYFRFPYLKEGKTKEKIDGMRSILEKEEYKNGYVTIDASDWYVNSRLVDKMRSGENVDTLAYQEFYLTHIIARAKYYESLSFELTGRHIKHTLLLHHNLTSALFLRSLINRFEQEDWNVVDAMEAYKDPIFQSRPTVIPAGESLIWSLAKESGTFEDVLRYPAEDSRYEKDEMNRLGL